MKCLAQTQGPKVRVNAVLPGLLLTEWVWVLQNSILENISNSAKGQRFSPEKIEGWKGKTALKRLVSYRAYSVRVY